MYFFSMVRLCAQVEVNAEYEIRVSSDKTVIKPVLAICEQQRRRSACASKRSDQRLCYSLPR